MAKLSDITYDQQIALLKFAKENGRYWKRKLLEGWEKAAYPGELQQIRNSHGSTWLMKLRLPKASV